MIAFSFYSNNIEVEHKAKTFFKGPKENLTQVTTVVCRQTQFFYTLMDQVNRSILKYRTIK